MNNTSNNNNDSFIENPDLLLSSCVENGNNYQQIVDTNSFISFDNSSISNNSNSIANAHHQLDFLQNQQEIKEELIEDDFNILELLQEDPDMLRLLESVNGDATNYLPQISLNSASKILDNIDLTQNLTEASLMSESSSFRNLCDLLSINNINNSHLSDAENKTHPKIKSSPLTPPISPPLVPEQTILQLNPTPRVSMRLIKKKSCNEDSSSSMINKSNKRSNNSTSKKAGGGLKRKRNYENNDQDSDNESELNQSDNNLLTSNPNSTNNSSNENSIDFSNEDSNSDYIYYNNNDDDDFLNDEYDGNERKQRRMSTDTSSEDPLKKESNKEAATRYRLKKLSEKDKLFETRVKLEKDNDHVKKRIELVQTEISYLKNLLVQMLLTKGVLNSSNFSMV